MCLMHFGGCHWQHVPTNLSQVLLLLLCPETVTHLVRTIRCETQTNNNGQPLQCNARLTWRRGTAILCCKYCCVILGREPLQNHPNSDQAFARNSIKGFILRRLKIVFSVCLIYLFALCAVESQKKKKKETTTTSRVHEKTAEFGFSCLANNFGSGQTSEVNRFFHFILTKKKFEAHSKFSQSESINQRCWETIWVALEKKIYTRCRRIWSAL